MGNCCGYYYIFDGVVGVGTGVLVMIHEAHNMKHFFIV